MKILVEIILWFGFSASLGAIFIFIRCLKRLMEIKEEQRRNEITARIARYHILNTLTQILEELKGGLKDGRRRK